MAINRLGITQKPSYKRHSTQGLAHLVVARDIVWWHLIALIYEVTWVEDETVAMFREDTPPVLLTTLVD